MELSRTFYSTALAWFLCINGFIEGEVMLSPVGVASVCPGDQLQLICTTSGQFVEWTVVLNARNNSLFISSMSGVASNFSRSAPASTTLFIASRNSTLNSSPLISVLSVHPIGSDLDGTMVICGGQSGSSTAVIDVIAEIDLHFQVNITLLSEQFVSDSVLVILEWNQRDFYSHNISVTPQLEYTADNSIIQLNVPYNAFYNINIIASPPCGQSSSNFIELHYYICRNPASNIESDSPGIEITGLNNLSVEGAVITFSCPNGSMLIGQTTSTCMGNGEWEPDPKDVECKASNSHQPLSEAGRIAVASVSVFLVTFALTFIIGYVTGHCCHKKSSKSAKMNTSPLYDTVQSEHSKRDVAMSENIAYSTVQPIVN